MLKIALAGNPNCGKTTLFNALTGSNQYVGNWPGVTVEKKEGKIRGCEDAVLVDLPGVYSLSPYTLEEVVARSYLVNERPDAILNVIDGSNIERNLYLTTQLVELGLPVVCAINMIDIVRKRGDKIDIPALSKKLGCPMVEISALKGTGMDEVARVAVETARSGKRMVPRHSFSGPVEHALAHIEELCLHDLPQEQQRWYAIKLFERDSRVIEHLHLPQDKLDHIENDIKACEEELDDISEAIITAARYDYIANILSGCFRRARAGSVTMSDKIDRVVTNRVLALPVFFLVMFTVYALAMGKWAISIGTIGSNWANQVLFGQWVPHGMELALNALGVSGWLHSLILDGIVAGVGSVLGFVPQLLVLFFLLSLLEDCGYMSRVAFIMDRLFRRFGLSGKSFIPLMVGSGCSVPGIMCTRTIEQDRDRKMTIMTTAFIPCGAKMPVVGMIAGALFGGSALVAASAYLIGIAAVIISGTILKKTRAFAGEPAPFVMELPMYHMPLLKSVLRTTWERGWDFIKRAATVILLSSIVLWFLQGYGFENGTFGAVTSNNDSLLAMVGSAVAWIFAPIGWVGDMAWKATVATFTGLIAKEEIINTFGVLYQVGNMGHLADSSKPLWQMIASEFTPLCGLSFLIFNLLCAPCIAAISAIHHEMNNPRWTAATLAYMCSFAYAIALIVYRIGGLLIGECPFDAYTVAAFVVLAVLLWLLLRPAKKLEGSGKASIDTDIRL